MRNDVESEYARLIQESPMMRRGLCVCRFCLTFMKVDVLKAMLTGWPTCCGGKRVELVGDSPMASPYQVNNRGGTQ